MDTGILDTMLATIAGFTTGSSGTITGYATSLYGILILLDFILAVLLNLGETDHIKQLVRKVLFYGFWIWIIREWGMLCDVLLDSLMITGTAVGGVDASVLKTPSLLIDKGNEIADPYWQYASQMDWLDITTSPLNWLMAVVGYAGVMLAFGILALQIFITYVEFYIASALLLIFIPWGSFKYTSFVAEKAIGAVISYGTKLMMLGAVYGLSAGIIDGMTVTLANGEPEPGTVLASMLGPFALCLLCWQAPGMAAGLMTGAPTLSAGTAAGTAVAGASAGGAMGAGVGSMAMGAGSNAAKAAAGLAGAATAGATAGGPGAGGAAGAVVGAAGFAASAFKNAASGAAQGVTGAFNSGAASVNMGGSSGSAGGSSGVSASGSSSGSASMGTASTGGSAAGSAGSAATAQATGASASGAAQTATSAGAMGAGSTGSTATGSGAQTASGFVNSAGATPAAGSTAAGGSSARASSAFAAGSMNTGSSTGSSTSGSGASAAFQRAIDETKQAVPPEATPQGGFSVPLPKDND